MIVFLLEEVERKREIVKKQYLSQWLVIFLDKGDWFKEIVERRIKEKEKKLWKSCRRKLVNENGKS